jgi:hypothetical protein
MWATTTGSNNLKRVHQRTGQKAATIKNTTLPVAKKVNPTPVEESKPESLPPVPTDTPTPVIPNPTPTTTSPKSFWQKLKGFFGGN